VAQFSVGGNRQYLYLSDTNVIALDILSILVFTLNKIEPDAKYNLEGTADYCCISYG
jgi:hypothetical protein